MGIKNIFCAIFIAYIFVVPAYAVALTVDNELEADSITQIIVAQADTSESLEAVPEKKIEDEEEPDCE